MLCYQRKAFSSGSALVQPEMERRRSPLVSNSTLRAGIFKASIRPPGYPSIADDAKIDTSFSLRSTTNLLQWSVLKRSARTTKSSEPLETKKG